MLQLDENSAAQEAVLAVGETFEIRLPENPTTGFRWHLESAGEPVCTLVEDQFEPPDAGRPGQGGTYRWRFRTLKAGRATIELAYRRAWQGPEASARKLTFMIRVSG